MFICKACAKHNALFTISRSFGPCEVCDIIGDCFDVPPAVLEGRILSAPGQEAADE